MTLNDELTPQAVKTKINYILNSAEELPQFPLVAMQVFNLCSDPETEPKDLENYIKKDPALVAKVLKIVNSSAFGFTKKVETVNQAIDILGFNGIKQAVMIGTISSIFTGEKGEVLWKQSIASAVAASEVFIHHKQTLEESAFLATLLHNIGRIILLQNFYKEYKHFLDYSDYDYLLTKEEKIFGLTHRELGAKLASKWQLPDSVIQGIENTGDTVGDEHLLRTALLLTYFKEEDLEFENRVSSYKKLKKLIDTKTQEQIELLIN